MCLLSWNCILQHLIALRADRISRRQCIVLGDGRVLESWWVALANGIIYPSVYLMHTASTVPSSIYIYSHIFTCIISFLLPSATVIRFRSPPIPSSSFFRDLTEMMMSAAVAIAVGLFLLVRLWSRFRIRGGKNLPPGSLGWPYIGETFQLYSQNPNVFFAVKQRRYGDIFKTHILGCPCIMIASPEAARFVLVKQAHLFKPTFPASKERMIGPQALFFHQGEYHARLRKLVLRSFLPEALRGIAPGIESLAVQALESWEAAGTINTFQETKRYAFNVAILSIFGRDETFDREDLKQAYYVLDKGYNSMPVNLPGTLFNKAMKARKHLNEILTQIIAARRANNVMKQDLLGSLMQSKDGSLQALTDNQIADNIIGVIFAAQDTTASVLTWILKYLSDHPAILQAVTAEQEAIRLSKADGELSLNWADVKNMPLTSRVIQETLRVASILSFTFREAVQDVEYKGYLIPKGWKVLPLFRNIHHSPEFFPDPQMFDPSRFEMPPKPNTFMPFGNGAHSCPGNEIAKLEMLILIHHLTTKYRWELVGSETGIQYGPFPVPKEGLPIKVSSKGSRISSVYSR